MSRIRTNFFTGTLSAGISSSATSISSSALAGFPVVAAPDIGVLVIDPSGTPEVVYITAHSASATTATITRGQEGTAAAAHSSGITIAQTAIATDFDPVTGVVYDNAGTGEFARNIVPATTATYDFGSSTKKLRDIYASRGVNVGGVWVYTIPTTTNAGDPEGQIIAPPGSLCLSENGLVYRKVTGTGNTGWEALAISRLSTVTRSGTTYTLAASDEFVLTEFSSSSAVTFTIPTNASVAIPVGAVFVCRQVGSGQVTVVGAGGVTVNGYAGLKSAGQWASFSLEKRATNTWLVEGVTVV